MYNQLFVYLQRSFGLVYYWIICWYTFALSFTYPIPTIEKYLQETYGILVYQEQLLLLPRLIADFNRAESDILCRAINEKQKDLLTELKLKFIDGGERNGHEKKTLERIWTVWEDMGSYSHNKSHIVSLTWLAYQMAYLKAHYPKEFMAIRKHYDYDISI